MVKTKKASIFLAALLTAGFVSSASAQMPAVACQTPVGVFPMPGGMPQPGLPCFGPAGPGITILIGGGMPGPFPGGMPGGFPPPFPQIQPSPQGMAAGQVAGAFGANREGQVAAQCAGQFGVTKAAAACIAGRLTFDELNKCFSDGIGGRGCFGDNNTLISMVRGNFEAAQRERGIVDQTIRATTGISPGAIREHGPLGGPNSDARNACNAVAGVFGGKC